jgi:diguanylate cyclase (GGDEF)-like protein/PAS domain S-box-containing protein
MSPTWLGTRVDGAHQLAAQLSAMRQFHKVVGEFNAARDLGATLRAVANGVVPSLGFEIAAVTVVRPDGDIEVAAVAGPPNATSLTGEVGDRATWDAMIANGDVWGPLRFVKYQVWPDGLCDAPGLLACEEDEPWQPMDGLLVPLRTPEGELVGVLSVDKPLGGREPMPWQIELLNVFAAQAAIAIDNARLYAEMVTAVEGLQTERRALRASEESFRQMFDGAPTGMALIGLHGNQQGRFVRVNKALCGMLEFTTAELHERTFDDLMHVDDRAGFEQLIGGDCVELRLRRGDGRAVWMSVRACVIAGADGRPEFRLAHIEDVDERMRREQYLVRLAKQDALTGLPNRNELHECVAHALARGRSVTLLLCDLNEFKAINDHYGHNAGDTVLVAVARRLSAGVRPGDVVARLGGDEFVVMACDLTKPEAHQLVKRLSRSLTAAVRLGEGRVISPSGSFGIGWVAAGARIGAEELLDLADRQMYQRKRARRAAHTGVFGTMGSMV